MILKKFLSDFKGLFKSPQSRFILMVGGKIMIFSIFIHFFVLYSLIQQLRFNYLFFETQSRVSLIELETFLGYVFSETLDLIPYIFAFHILLFLAGCYVGWILLRPFFNIAKYSEEAITDVNASYQPEVYSNYNLLTRFSEFFFLYLRENRLKKQLTPQSIPPQFSKIHRPKLDVVYLIHFSFLLLIIGIVTFISAASVIDILTTNILKLALDLLPDAKDYKSFFLGQIEIFEDIYIWIVLLTVALYGGLAFHLYDKMSGAAFGIFSTMRSFMKGNYSSRVHLLGFNHVRDYTRTLNKFLNHVTREFQNETKDTEES
ncbi:MAG TPA: hypothetical protein VKY27_03730 [Bacteriovoracaceae bacterium]|nr:hypothetical protein [Bacteriovoracaceae bacterium]